MLTGCATPYLHNGEEDAKVGITGRNDIGFLIWDKDEKTTVELNLGSRFKTPFLPVWVTLVNGAWGVLFNPNKDLMKSYSAENRSDFTQTWSVGYDNILGSSFTTSVMLTSRRRKILFLILIQGARKLLQLTWILKMLI